MAKKKAQVDSENSEIPLEAAMLELGQIVSRLESGQETLDASLAQFERGMSLLRTCHRRLDAAAQRIELVTQLASDGDVVTEEFDSTSTLQRSSSADATRTARKATRTDNKPETVESDESDDDSGLLF